MRALLISDIHANIDALDAVLEAAPEHDLVWNLGDVVGYGAAPNEVIECVRGLGEIFVRGNHDRACSGQLSLEDFNPVASRAARWTRQVLTPEHIDWLQHMVRGPITPDGPQVSCMHAVSYTHLDVYKRQESGRPATRYPRVPSWMLPQVVKYPAKGSGFSHISRPQRAKS